MSPFDAEIIQAKLSVIVENLKALEPIQGMNREEYFRDLYKRIDPVRRVPFFIRRVTTANRTQAT